MGWSLVGEWVLAPPRCKLFAMTETTWLTQGQFDTLTEELNERKTVRREKIARLIDAARQEGDLSENAGYHAAREQQSMNETRVLQLEELLAGAEVDSHTGAGGTVAPGMVVTAIIGGKEETFLLGARDAGGDLGMRVYSPTAPIGKAINGAKEGDKLSYEVPSGAKIDVEIIEAKPYEG